MYQNYDRASSGKQPLERLRRWKDNINMHLKGERFIKLLRMMSSGGFH
jgi:Ca2+-binding EF-hand superfamily protein